MKNRMKALYAAVTEAREAGTNRRLCDLFMVKPSKKDYADYYKVGMKSTPGFHNPLVGGLIGLLR